MKEEAQKKGKGILISFEEKFSKYSEDGLVNYQQKMNDFISRQEDLCGRISNISFCPNCNSDKVFFQKIDYPLITNNRRFKSVKLIGAICSNCGENYIKGQEVRHIEETVKIINSYCNEENDYVETNVSYCDVCEGNNIDNVELEVCLISNNSNIISVAVQEDYCSNCNAVYFAKEADQLVMDHLMYFYLTQ